MEQRIITCIIVDDEPLAVKLLEKFVGQTPFLSLKASFTDPVAALQYLQANTVDLLFLDIEMPDMDGMELARLTAKHTRIIFTTAYKDYALDSYEVSALDYLLKPIRLSKFLAAAEKAREWFALIDERDNAPQSPMLNAQCSMLNVQSSKLKAQSPKSSAFLRINGERVRVDFSRVVLVEGMKDYVRFHLDGERIPLTTHMTMAAAEELLPRDRFLRIHRSYIVAKDKIDRVDSNNYIYVGKQAIHVTEAYLEAFRKFLE